MALETGTYIDDLVTTNPDGSIDPKSAGDNHLRLIKSTLKATFPGMAGAAWRVQTKSGNYTLAATDNMTQINVTAAATISGTAATLGNQFIALIYNAYSAAITIPSYTLPAGSAVLMTCNGSSFHHFPFAFGVLTLNGLTVNGAVGITTGGLGVVGGITVTVGNIAVSAGTLSASGNISTSAGTITSPGIVRGGNAYTAYCYISADATNSIHAFDNNDYIAYNRSSNTFAFVIGGAPQAYLSDGSLFPAVDSDVNFGGSSNRWNIVYSTNGVVTTSDKRRKDHVEDIANTGPIIDAMRPVRFRWKQTGKLDAGFYAQDEAENVPEAVEPGTDEIDWGWKPDRVIPYLVAEIKALRRRVAELESR